MSPPLKIRHGLMSGKHGKKNNKNLKKLELVAFDGLEFVELAGLELGLVESLVYKPPCLILATL